MQAARRPWTFLGVLSTVSDLLFITALVVLLEIVGTWSIHDGTDFLALIGAGLLATAFLKHMPDAHAPLREALAAIARRVGRRFVALVEPRFALALRPTPGVEAPRDTVLRGATIACLVALVVLVLQGGLLRRGQLALRADGWFTAHLLHLAFVLGVYMATLAGGTLVAGRIARRLAQHGVSRGKRIVAIGVALAIVPIALCFLPGIVPVLAILIPGAVRTRAAARAPAEPYLLCRRDAHGRWMSIRLVPYIARAQAAGTIALAAIAALAGAHRLWDIQIPHAPFALTDWLGLSATGAALLMAERLGRHLMRLAGLRGPTVERPLVPTLWWNNPEGEGAPAEAAWVHGARLGGWWIAEGESPPKPGFDLVVGPGVHPQRFVPPGDAVPVEAARFSLDRRFHVVRRRIFMRALERLLGEARTVADRPGSGFLVCPHIRFLPGLVRDAEPTRRRRTGASMSATVYGRPYAEAFDFRTRRYFGMIVRHLEIDAVFIGDGVSWPCVRRAMSVLFECYDQDRTPLDARHFHGLPGIRAMIETESADVDAQRNGGLVGDDDARSPGQARFLAILRDRGDGEPTEADVPADTTRLAPTLG